MSQLDAGSLDNFEELMAQGKMFGSDLSLRELQVSLRYTPTEALLVYTDLNQVMQCQMSSAGVEPMIPLGFIVYAHVHVLLLRRKS